MMRTEKVVERKKKKVIDVGQEPNRDVDVASYRTELGLERRCLGRW